MKNSKNISKWLNNEMSEEEFSAFQTTDDYTLYKDIVETGSKIKLTSINEEVALKDFKARIKTRTKKKPQVISLKNNFIFKVAASIALLVAVSYFLLNNSQTTLKTNYAENKSFTLPDESIVDLNAVSTITYAKSFLKNRELELEGEAYFKVKKGSSFTVNTSQGSVQVLGTKFNVKNREKAFNVFCYEGRVEVKHGTDKIILTKGEGVQLVNNNKLIKINNTSLNEPLWLNNESYFNQEIYDEVLAEFERQFNVKIITNNIDTGELFTGGFNNNNLETALKSITLPFNINYQIKDNEIVLSK
ncbi:FecR family protein [Lutibacter maritimus]|uniref:FecR family protein n=1 Tax=Lutibacter maritimus TaxID=593133 RepID=A0A1I6PJA4_9FLAO|nr:FecR family protein [Lutibacter maritimus]SFS40294.1 FecR family protein [Lutibacter maritimus]